MDILKFFNFLTWFDDGLKKPVSYPAASYNQKPCRRFNNNTKGAFGKCKINKMMCNMRVYPRHRVKQALEEMMK